jgi:hypothetical protein
MLSHGLQRRREFIHSPPLPLSLLLLPFTYFRVDCGSSATSRNDTDNSSS